MMMILLFFSVSLKPIRSPQSSAGSKLTTTNMGGSRGRGGGLGFLQISSSLQDLQAYRKASVNGENIKECEEGVNIFFEEEEGRGGVSKQVFRIALGVFLVSFVLLTALYLGFLFLRLGGDGVRRYAVVLDCGSTGTRVYVYSWLELDSNRIPSIEELPAGGGGVAAEGGMAYIRTETRPGLAKLLGNKGDILAAINPLLKQAEALVPQAVQSETPLFLLATAGLRKLAKSESDWIFDHIWSKSLATSPFLCRRSWLKVISGEEEAKYGWVALNYNLHRLTNEMPATTFGALDLGGSSLQVTFETATRNYDENLTIASGNHQLHAHSHRGLGLDDAFCNSINLLYASLQPLESTIPHPCLHQGYKQMFSLASCGNPPSHDGQIDLPPPNHNDIEVELVGAPNWPKCKSLAYSSVNSSSINSSIDSSINIENIDPSAHFYALSGFYVVYKFFGLAGSDGIEKLLDKGERFCGKSWEEARASVPPQPFIEQFCFRSAYVAALLQDRLHLKQEQIVVGSGNISWTLGAALLEAIPFFTPTQIITRQPPSIGSSSTTIPSGLGLASSSGLGFSYLSLGGGSRKPLVLLFVVGVFVLLVLAAHSSQGIVVFRRKTASFSSSPSKLHSVASLGAISGMGGLRNGDGRFMLPHISTPLMKEQSYQRPKFNLECPLGEIYSPILHSGPPMQANLPFTNNRFQYQKGISSKLQSRRNQSRDDLQLSVTDKQISRV